MKIKFIDSIYACKRIILHRPWIVPWVLLSFIGFYQFLPNPYKLIYLEPSFRERPLNAEYTFYNKSLASLIKEKFDIPLGLNNYDVVFKHSVQVPKVGEYNSFFLPSPCKVTNDISFVSGSKFGDSAISAFGIPYATTTFGSDIDYMYRLDKEDQQVIVKNITLDRVWLIQKSVMIK